MSVGTDEHDASDSFEYVAEYAEKDKLQNEKNVLGIYISGHPLGRICGQT